MKSPAFQLDYSLATHRYLDRVPFNAIALQMGDFLAL